MTRTRTLRAKNPTDLLAMVPFLLGFHPHDSVVLLTLGDAGSPVHARLDLPGDPAEVPDLVAHLVAVAVHAAVTRIAVVVYGDDEVLAEAVARPLARSLVEAGLEVPACLRADGERWYCLGDGAATCARSCPPEGTPYDLARHPLTLEAVVQGRVVLPSRDALRDSLVGDDPEEAQRVAEAVERAGERLLEACGQPAGPPDPAAGRRGLVVEGRWVQHRIGRFLRDGRRLESHDVGRLLVAVASIEVRDVAWAEIRHDDAVRHVDLWRDVVRRSPRDHVAAPAALLAFAAWLAGDGALAWCAVDCSQDAEPGYGLAGLVGQALAGAVPPSSWRPLGSDALSLFAG